MIYNLPSELPLDLRKVLVCTLLFTIPFLGTSDWLSPVEPAPLFHSPAEINFFGVLQDSLPTGYNGLFAASGECVECHGFDTAFIANVDALGNDINVVDDWRATMMANSAKDPFWRAKVSHEVLIYPEHQEIIETKCTSCHAPLGHFKAFHAGASQYSIAEMVADSFALDGVSCLACHQQPAADLGNQHSGDLLFDTNKVAFGPFISPLESPMLEATNYKPVYSEHISDAGLCAGCHTLLTETIDLEGNLTGNHFVEQATYHEWLNSRYQTDNISCQSCHLPELNRGPFYLANDFETEARENFYLHDLVGANTTMLKLMKDNAAELNISATPEQFDEVIAKTAALLRNNTLTLQTQVLERTSDTLFLAVSLGNRAGHKFPSGYPARRAVLQLIVQNENGDTLFASGNYDENFEVFGQNATYEPHYTTIRSEEEVQIYEMVMGDVNGNVTTVLERAATPIKDNRLPPQGFTTGHSVYDTTLIAGNALTDTDFNWENGEEGSGKDVVYYHIPMLDPSAMLIVTTNVYYQATPPKWMEEMFAETSPEIEKFRQQFDAADRSPFLIRTDSVHVGSIVNTDIIPSPFPAKVYLAGKGQIMVESPENAELSIFDISGKLLHRQIIQQGVQSISYTWPAQIVVAHIQAGKHNFARRLWLY